MSKLYDTDVLESIGIFIVTGIEPGSFGKACMELNKERAYECAHRALLPCAHSQYQDIVANMLEFCEQHMPGHLVGDRDALVDWANMGGLLEADDNTKLMMRLQSSEFPWYLRKIKPQFRPWVMGYEGAKQPSYDSEIWQARIL